MRNSHHKVVAIREPEAKRQALSGIISRLPEWFGQPESNSRYCNDVADKDCWAVRDTSGSIIGLIALSEHFGATVEIWWMGVLPEFHRGGIGRELMEHAVASARQHGARFMVVETLSARDPDLNYRRTRQFYEAMGFTPLMEHDLSDPQNPLMLMLRPLA